MVYLMSALQIRSLLSRTFWAPFMSWRRSAVLMASFLGSFGFSLIMVVPAYDLSTVGLKAMMAYFLPVFMVSGFLLYPLLYAGFSMFDSSRWRIGILAAQSVALILYVILPQDPLSRGLAGAVIMAPFWCAYHIAMIQNTTEDNRSFEVALAGVLYLAGGVLGYFASGASLAYGLQGAAFIAAFLSLALATGSALVAPTFMPSGTLKAFLLACHRVLAANPYIVPRIVAQSLLEMPGLVMAALMRLLNFPPSVMAGMLIARLVLSFAFAPVWGHFVRKHKSAGFGLAFSMVGIAWLFLFFFAGSTVAFFVFLLVYGLGTSLADNSLSTGLYGIQSYAVIVWNEILNAAGRGVFLLFLLPLLYASVQLYLIALCGVCVLLLVLDGLWKRKWGTVGAM
jgi:hypothetical protein